VVSNLNDSGTGSLRAAITAANADSSGTPTAINFSVNGIINLASALPAITHATTIDATSAPTHASGGPPVVDSAVCALRKKLVTEVPLIHTRRGMGYVLEVQASSVDEI